LGMPRGTPSSSAKIRSPFKTLYFYRCGFASHPASCAYPRSHWMMGSTCSAGSHLGMSPLASNGLRPTNRAPGFVFCALMAMHAPRVLKSFRIVFWKVFKSSTDFWIVAM
jgi:hypothetical protein